MKKEQIIEKTNVALCSEFEKEPQQLKPSDNIKDSLELDSLGFVDMVALLEDEFSIQINGKDIVQLKTFADLYDYLEIKIAS